MEKDLIALLSTYDWIHNSKVTNFFVERVWEKIPSEWIETLKGLTVQDLNMIPSGFIKEVWPASLKDFFRAAVCSGSHRYKIKKYENDQKEITKAPAKGMNPKKQHEIEKMVTFLDEFLKDKNCHHVVDVGSGLAYLDLALAEVGFKVIGLELDGAKVSKANGKAHSGKLNGQFESLSYCLKKDEQSITNLGKLIDEKWGLEGNPGEEVCLTGLHCCGDLSPAMIEVFLKVPRIKHLIFFGCCYHSMEADGEGFKNFPLSKKLSNSGIILNKFSLRLAAQQTRSSWEVQTEEDHHLHCLNVSFRSILELASTNSNLLIKKLRGKLAQITQQTSFKSYLAEAATRSTVGDWGCLEEIVSLYDEYKLFNAFIEPFTMFQVMFQPVIEYLILVDRCEYIRECGHECRMIQLFDDEISPRNCAIIASK